MNSHSVPAEHHLPGQAGNSSCRVSGTDGQGWDRNGNMCEQERGEGQAGPVGRENLAGALGWLSHLRMEFSSLGVTALLRKASPIPGLLAGAWRFREFYSECYRLDKKYLSRVWESAGVGGMRWRLWAEQEEEYGSELGLV